MLGAVTTISHSYLASMMALHLEPDVDRTWLPWWVIIFYECKLLNAKSILLALISWLKTLQTCLAIIDTTSSPWILCWGHSLSVSTPYLLILILRTNSANTSRLTGATLFTLKARWVIQLLYGCMLLKLSHLLFTCDCGRKRWFMPSSCMTRTCRSLVCSWKILARGIQRALVREWHIILKVLQIALRLIWLRISVRSFPDHTVWIWVCRLILIFCCQSVIWIRSIHNQSIEHWVWLMTIGTHVDNTAAGPISVIMAMICICLIVYNLVRP